jgi:iron complex outermembrane receptor protein
MTNPLETTGMAGASYFKYNNNQSTYFAIDYLTYKPWGLLSCWIKCQQNQLRQKRFICISGLITGHKDQSFEKQYETAYTPHFAYRKNGNIRSLI